MRLPSGCLSYLYVTEICKELPYSCRCTKYLTHFNIEPILRIWIAAPHMQCSLSCIPFMGTLAFNVIRIALLQVALCCRNVYCATSHHLDITTPHYMCSCIQTHQLSTSTNCHPVTPLFVVGKQVWWFSPLQAMFLQEKASHLWLYLEMLPSVLLVR